MARKASAVDEKMLKVEGTTSIGLAEAPGKLPEADVEFEGLGLLSEFPSQSELEKPEGTGEHCVVLCDFMTGVDGHGSFRKGDVVRLSWVIAGYTDRKVSRETVKSRIKELFNVRALRKATRDEKKLTKVEVTMESESQSVAQERNRRIELENENELLRQKLMEATGAVVAATPGQAEASDAAQLQASKEDSEDVSWDSVADEE